MRFAGLFVAVALGCGIAFADEPILPSGTTFLSEDLKSRQADDAANPGMLWVEAGRALWRDKVSTDDNSCSSCHGDAATSMRGVATRYPAVDRADGRLLNLEGRINACRTEHMNAPEFAPESDDLLAITSFVAHQSRGLPINVEIDGAAQQFYERGRSFFFRRRGQLNLSCANCHVEHASRRLRGDTISHAVTNGYPAYRLEWQSIGSLHRRLRSCARGVRSVAHPIGSQVYLELELFLAHRSNGATIETPALRR